MTNLTKIELIVASKDAKTIVGLVAETALELHVTAWDNEGGQAVATPKRRARRAPNKEEALKTCRTQPSVRCILNLVRSKAVFTWDEAQGVSRSAGFSSKGASSAISRLKAAGLVKKIKSRPATWEFDRAAIQAAGILKD